MGLKRETSRSYLALFHNLIFSLISTYIDNAWALTPVPSGGGGRGPCTGPGDPASPDGRAAGVDHHHGGERPVRGRGSVWNAYLVVRTSRSRCLME